MSKVVGALTPEEQAVIDERDRYRDQFFAAGTDGEREELMRKINDATARYDALRKARWDAGGVDLPAGWKGPRR